MNVYNINNAYKSKSVYLKNVKHILLKYALNK